MENNASFVATRSAGEPYLVRRPEGYFEYQMPISVKGILTTGSAVLLVGNPRGELELPGGKLELGETPEACIAREIAEETGLAVSVAHPVHGWVYRITSSRHVFVLAYGVKIEGDASQASVLASPEVGHAGWTDLSKLDDVSLPQEYRNAIRAWLRSQPEPTLKDPKFG